jgi:hypothetical protein
VNTREFWLATLEWVAKGIVAALATAYLNGAIHSWADVATAAAGAAAVMLAMAFGSRPFGDPASPALVGPSVADVERE